MKYKLIKPTVLSVSTLIGVGVSPIVYGETTTSTHFSQSTNFNATNLVEKQLPETSQGIANEQKAGVTQGYVEIKTDTAVLDKAVDTAHENNVPITQTAIVVETPVVAEKVEEKQAEIQSDYKAQAKEITAKVDTHVKAVEQYEKDKAETIAINEKISKDNDEKLKQYNVALSQYEKEVSDFTNATEKYNQDIKDWDNLTNNLDTKVTKQVTAITESNPHSPAGSTYMNSTITGNDFELSHDMVVDSGNVGYGKLAGRVNSDYAINKDGSITVTIKDVLLKDYDFVSTNPNHLNNSPASFHVFDINGSEVWGTGEHNVRSSFYHSINKSVIVNKTINIPAGQTTGEIKVMSVHDNWQFDTAGAINVIFTNTSTISPIPDRPTPPIPVGDKPEPPVYENFKPLPIEPIAPKLSYHYHELRALPTVEKTASNKDDVNVHAQTIAKGSVVRWTLHTKPLPAKRDITDTFIITDLLPQGYVVDEAQTKLESKDFTVVYDKDAHLITFTGTADMLKALNKNLNEKLQPLAPIVVGTVTNDNATYTNNFNLNVNNEYSVYSNTVKVQTPSRIEPTKRNQNKDGLIIDGKQVLSGSTNYYVLTWDLDQYKGMKASKEDISKGFFYLDDYPEEAVTIDTKNISITDSKGVAIKGVSVKTFDSLEKADERVKALLGTANIVPKGAFQLFMADNPEQFFNDYVVTGTTITIVDPMIVKDELGKTGGRYENKAYQIDFGNGYETETVVNNVPKLEAKKDVIDVTGKSIDGKVITLGQAFEYGLHGAILPSNRADKLWEYAFHDNYDETGDKYTGEYRVVASVDFKLVDGTVVKKGTDLTEETVEIFEIGEITIALKPEFLEKVALESEFGASAYIEMTRIRAGEVENTFENIVNGQRVVSNTVKTTTPQPPAPPITVTPPREILPKTGERADLSVLGFGFSSLLTGLFVFKKRQKGIKNKG